MLSLRYSYEVNKIFNGQMTLLLNVLLRIACCKYNNKFADNVQYYIIVEILLCDYDCLKYFKCYLIFLQLNEKYFVKLL